MPTSMLDLSRELYLICCSYLDAADLAILAGASRDHYLAAQEPLYARVSISRFAALTQLVGTLVKVPVVSRISPQQRQRWYQLSDAQLCERDIRYMNFVLDAGKDSQRINGAYLERFVGAITRKCPNAKITMTVRGTWPGFVKHLNGISLPNILKLDLYLGGQLETRDKQTIFIWDVLFGGSTFPDLRSVYFNTTAGSEADLPQTLGDAAKYQGSDSPHYGYRNDRQLAAIGPFYGLQKMESIKLEQNTLLTVPLLQSLFGSDIIPSRLTTLELSECGNLGQVRHLKELSMLLQRALPLVQRLKMHLSKDHFNASNIYNAKLAGAGHPPEEHLCNVIRVCGQKIKNLDIAVPYACYRIFEPSKRAKSSFHNGEVFPIPQEPINTLPERMIAAGYKHRRVICWDGVCGSAHSWDEMEASVDGLEEAHVSWELLSASTDMGSWHVSGYAPVLFSAQDMIGRPIRDGEAEQ